MSEAVIRRMQYRDVRQVAAIEAAVFPRPWSEESFRREVQENVVARYLVAEKDGRILGYAGAWVVLDECHITNIAVREEARGRGIGKKLTAELLYEVFNVRNTGTRVITSRVRFNSLLEQMNIVIKALDKYKEHPERRHNQRMLQAHLRKESAFAEFKRAYVRKRLGEFPGLKEYLV